MERLGTKIKAVLVLAGLCFSLWTLCELLAPRVISVDVYNENRGVFIISNVNQTSKEISIEGHHDLFTLPRACYAQYISDFPPPHQGKVRFEVEWNLTGKIIAGKLSEASVVVSVLLLDTTKNTLDMNQIYSINVYSDTLEISIHNSNTGYFKYNTTVYPQFLYYLAIRLHVTLSGASSFTSIDGDIPAILTVQSIEGFL